MGYTLRGAENIVTEGPILDSPKQYHLIVQHISHRPYHSNETVHNVQFFLLIINLQISWFHVGAHSTCV